MSVLYSVLLILSLGQYVLSGPDPKDVKCLVCRKVVEEIENIIDKVSPSKTVEVGSYRLDSEGNQRQKTIPYARSVVHLTEVLENVCKKFEDYVKATYKASGDLTILKLIDDNGKMNPEMSKVDVVPDADLNKSLKFYCEGIVEEYEDDFIKLFGAAEENIDVIVCADRANYCDIELPEDYNFEDKDEL
ncbi:hypothetical protein J437_LFUL008337 [Ladona fulva]|uniref:DUF3456 domain-containing protein n=1 Tax=Ladona fulva TaxID=123851 RepID=A0A8K0K5P9_LADFU|nr:hypothetical protein J437_LFUL008337 [Ladona fulva]